MMKNFCKTFGMVVLVSLIVFSFAACNNAARGGSLTITGIPPEYNGKYAIAFGGVEDTYTSLIAAVNIRYDMNNFSLSGTAGQIRNGSVTIKLWEPREDGSTVGFSGSGMAFFEVLIVNTATLNDTTMSDERNFLSEGEVEAVLTNGSGRGVFEDWGWF